MQYSLFASLGFILLLGTSCRKNDSDSNLPPGSIGSKLDSITSRAVSDNSVLGGAKFKYDGTGNVVQYIANNLLTTQFRYDAQNHLTNVSAYSNPRSSSGDTLIYSANGRIVRSHHNVSGTISPVPSRTYVFDNNNRLILDSIYNGPFIGFARWYLKYNYNTTDDLQSVVLYAFDLNSATRYSPGDSLVRTYDTNENPFYRCSFAFYNVYFKQFTAYSTFDPIIYNFDLGLSLSKHNLVSSTSFRSASTQPGTTTSYNSTYYTSGLIHTQVVGYGYNGNYDIRNEFLYQ